MVEISTDSLIQISKQNINKVLNKTKYEHDYSDSVSNCLDSIKHELKIKESKLKKAQQIQSRQLEAAPVEIVAETHKIEAYNVREVAKIEMVEYKQIEYKPDTVFIYDTIYIDTTTSITKRKLRRKDKENE